MRVHPTSPKMDRSHALKLREKMEGMREVQKEHTENELKMHTSCHKQLSTYLNDKIFPGLPPHYPLRKKLVISRTTTNSGATWDMIQIFLTVVACITYVIGTLPISLTVTKWIHRSDIVMAQFFFAEFLLNWYIVNHWTYFTDFVTIIDFLSILPVYASFVLPNDTYSSVEFLQSLRILRLTRIFKSFKLMRNLGGVKRQVVYLTVTLISLIFLAAGIVQIVENDYVGLDCKYINVATAWKPSCTTAAPAEAWCSCEENNCRSVYGPDDTEGKPTRITCTKLSFFEAFYYIVVTVSTVGYGDIRPGNFLSKIFIVIFVVACLIVIPMSISRLQTLLSQKSAFRRPYIGAPEEAHIIVCGHVNDARKLTRFFSEFFHEDRVVEREYHAVVLSPHEPTEEVRALLAGQLMVSRVTYIIGTAMATEDLKRAKADTARCMFFLCNTDVKKGNETNEDAATILRALSVSNYNPELECLVQVLRPEERVILKDSDVDCILCLDEFKTVLQARNAVCPGFSTFVENIFHSVDGVAPESPLHKTMAGWYKEYLHGAGMELYFVDLDHNFLRNSQYSFSVIAEIIYLEFGVLSLGVCNAAKDSIVFNPRIKDLTHYANMKDFFHSYSVLLVLTDDQKSADLVSKTLADASRMREANLRLLSEEENFPCRSIRIPGAAPPSPSQYDGGGPAENDNDVDADEPDLTSYIGFASYLPEGSADVRESSPTMIEANTYGIKLPTTIKGPTVSKLPPQQMKGTKARKVRMLPDIKLVKQHAVISERQVLGDMTHTAFQLGQVSITLDDASTLTNHVVVFGSDAYTMMFISELRRPAVVGDSYHPIVIFSEQQPTDWETISARFNDVYYIKASTTRNTVVNKANLEKAFSLIFLSNRGSYVDGDAVTLFSFLKLEQIIPPHVFCSLELNSTENMGVLNATIMKKERRVALENGINYTRSRQRVQQFDVVSKRKVRKSSIEVIRERNLEKRGSVLRTRGTFVQKRTTKASVARDTLSNENQTIATKSRARDLDINAEETTLTLQSLQEHTNEKTLWEAIDTHYIFPVYACARVFVPSSFETLLVQSFFVKLTPVICERFICGQLSQTVQQMSMPRLLVGRRFIDLFRLFASSNAIILALYRAPCAKDGSLLPFVFTSPPPDTILYENDKMFVFASPTEINICKAKSKVARGKTQGIYGI